jgi:CRISPR-associated protein Csx10
MRRFLLNFTAQEPLILSDGSSETMAHRSLDYIPGNMVLGALAGRWLERRRNARSRPDDDPVFRSLFLDGSVSWGHAYPMVGEAACWPIPKAFFKLKNDPDLPVVGSGQEGTVINRLVQDPDSIHGLPNDEAEEENQKQKRCSPGFLAPDTLVKPDHKTGWAMHVALDQSARSAIEGLLFGFSSLGEGSRFQSETFVQEPAVDAFKELLDSVRLIRVGHGRSAGYGSASIDGFAEQPLASQPPVPQGLCRVFLVSDFVAKNSWLQPVDSLLDELKPFLGPAQLDDSFTIFADHAVIAGFNNLWRLPRPSRTALVKGSVLEFTVHEPPDQTPPWPPCFGAFTTEGYGRLILNPPFLAPPRHRSQAGAAPPQASKPAAVLSDAAVAALRTMRARSMDREIQKMISDKLYLKDSKIANFINDLSKTKLTTSQLGKIRNLITNEKREKWLSFFENEMKKSTIKKKWTCGSASSPIPGDHGRKENTDVIINYLLNSEFPKKFVNLNQIELLGEKNLTESETNIFYEKFHIDFLLQLLTIWRQKLRENT